MTQQDQWTFQPFGDWQIWWNPIVQSNWWQNWWDTSQQSWWQVQTDDNSTVWVSQNNSSDSNEFSLDNLWTPSSNPHVNIDNVQPFWGWDEPKIEDNSLDENINVAQKNWQSNSDLNWGVWWNEKNDIQLNIWTEQNNINSEQKGWKNINLNLNTDWDVGEKNIDDKKNIELNLDDTWKVNNDLQIEQNDLYKRENSNISSVEQKIVEDSDTDTDKSVEQVENTVEQVESVSDEETNVDKQEVSIEEKTNDDKKSEIIDLYDNLYDLVDDTKSLLWDDKNIEILHTDSDVLLVSYSFSLVDDKIIINKKTEDKKDDKKIEKIMSIELNDVWDDIYIYVWDEKAFQLSKINEERDVLRIKEKFNKFIFLLKDFYSKKKKELDSKKWLLNEFRDF